MPINTVDRNIKKKYKELNRVIQLMVPDGKELQKEIMPGMFHKSFLFVIFVVAVVAAASLNIFLFFFVFQSC